MYGAYGQGGQQQSQYGYNQQSQQQQQYGAPPPAQQQQFQYQQQQPQYQPQLTQQQQQVANNVNVVQPEQVVESSKPAPIYVDTQHDDMVRHFISLYTFYSTSKTFTICLSSFLY